MSEELREVVARLAPGMLLVATPALTDPNFERTVVLIIDHNSDGTIGVVVNRPSDRPVEMQLSGWEGLLRPPGVMFHGGPVSDDAVLGLAEITGDPPESWTSVFANIGPIDLRDDPETLSDTAAGLRIFSGYAGWGPGQLGAEVFEGSWWVVPAFPDDPLSTEPEELWARVLGRQSGELAWFEHYPVDPEVN